MSNVATGHDAYSARLRRRNKIRWILKRLQLIHAVQAAHPRLLYRKEWLNGLPVFEVHQLRLVK